MKSDIGPMSANVMAAGMIVPAKEKIIALVDERPSCLPNGMANFISRNGVMAAKNVIISGCMV